MNRRKCTIPLQKADLLHSLPLREIKQDFLIESLDSRLIPSSDFSADGFHSLITLTFIFVHPLRAVLLHIRFNRSILKTLIKGNKKMTIKIIPCDVPLHLPTFYYNVIDCNVFVSQDRF